MLRLVPSFARDNLIPALVGNSALPTVGGAVTFIPAGCIATSPRFDLTVPASQTNQPLVEFPNSERCRSAVPPHQPVPAVGIWMTRLRHLFQRKQYPPTRSGMEVAG